MINFNNVKIFSGNSNLELAKKIAEKAGLQLGKAKMEKSILKLKKLLEVEMYLLFNLLLSL